MSKYLLQWMLSTANASVARNPQDQPDEAVRISGANTWDNRSCHERSVGDSYGARAMGTLGKP